MPRDGEAIRLAQKYGLAIQTVSWEDCGRNKNSSWGPCISDMTLQVGTHRLPVIRTPNFSDLTWDIPMDKIQLTVGNQNGSELHSVSLKYYLSHINEFLSSSTNSSRVGSLLAPSRDSHVIASSQACFLPIPAGSETEFNVAIFNYQSRVGHPAVLSIVATRNGTSAQVIEAGSQKLYFNANGQRASFVGQRLKENRRERGEPEEGAMTQQEKEQNVILILQVPLKHPEPIRRPMLIKTKCAIGAPAPSSCSSRSSRLSKKNCERDESSNVDEAIIKVSETTSGIFHEFGSSADPLLERDDRFPIRATLQFYKATDNGVLNDADVSHVATQLRDSRRQAEFVGSLVVDGNTSRPTEMRGVPAREIRMYGLPMLAAPPPLAPVSYPPFASGLF